MLEQIKGYLDVRNAVLRVGRLDVQTIVRGVDTSQNIYTRDSVLLWDDQGSDLANPPFTLSSATRSTSPPYLNLGGGYAYSAIRLPNSWLSAFDVYVSDKTDGSVKFHLYTTDTTSYSDTGYELLLNNSGVTLKYDGTQVATASYTWTNSTWQQVVVGFERGAWTVSVDGEPVLVYDDDERDAVYANQGQYLRVDASDASTTKRIRYIKVIAGDKWLQSNVGHITYTQGNVGIGTTDASGFKLHVEGNANFSNGYVGINDGSNYGKLEMGGPSGAYIDMKNPYSDDYDSRIQQDGYELRVLSKPKNAKTFAINNETGNVHIFSNLVVDTTTLFVDADANRVGIGSTLPRQRLDVTGTVEATYLHSNNVSGFGGLELRGSSGGYVDFSKGDAVDRDFRILTDGEDLNISARDSGYAMKIGRAEANVHVTSNLLVDTTSLYVDKTLHNVGIGTSLPSLDANLHVSGGLLVDTSSDMGANAYNYTSTSFLASEYALTVFNTSDYDPPIGVYDVVKGLYASTNDAYTSWIERDILDGDTVTVSFYARKTPSDGTISIQLYLQFDDLDADGSPQSISTDYWVKVSKTYTASSNGTFKFRIDNNTSGTTLLVTGLTMRVNATDNIPFTPYGTPSTNNSAYLKTPIVMTEELHVQNTSGTSAFIATNSGKVGINTTAPETGLDIWGTNAVRVHGTTGSTRHTYMQHYFGSAGAWEIASGSYSGNAWEWFVIRAISSRLNGQPLEHKMSILATTGSIIVKDVYRTGTEQPSYLLVTGKASDSTWHLYAMTHSATSWLVDVYHRGSTAIDYDASSFVELASIDLTGHSEQSNTYDFNTFTGTRYADGNLSLGVINTGHRFEARVGTADTPISSQGNVARFSAVIDGSSSSHYSLLDIKEIPEASPVSWVDWTTRIQRTIDSTNQGYIDFGPPNGSSNEDVAIGYSTTENFRFTKTARLGIGTNNPGTALQISRSFTSTGDTSSMISFENTASTYYDWQIGPSIVSNNACFKIRGNADGFGSLSDLFIIRGSDVGIGTDNPQGFKLRVEGAQHNTASMSAGHFVTYDGQTSGGIYFTGDIVTARWQICVGGAYTLAFRRDSGASGSYVTQSYITSSGAYTDSFTGQHNCQIKEVPHASVSEYEGLIVCANNNEYISLSAPQLTVNQGAVSINESLPILSVSTKAYDKTCFGVVSSSEDPETRESKKGSFVTIHDKEEGDTRIFVNSLGEGAIWVVNTNGPLQSGDYITTSDVAGYGMRQESEFLANYTVAKVTQDVTFDPPLKPVKRIVKELANVTYWTQLEILDYAEWSNVEPLSAQRISYETYYAVDEHVEVFGEIDKQSNIFVAPQHDLVLYTKKQENIISEEVYNALPLDERDLYTPDETDGTYVYHQVTTISEEVWGELGVAEQNTYALGYYKIVENIVNPEDKPNATERKRPIYKKIKEYQKKKPEKDLDQWETEVKEEWVNVLGEHGQLQWEDDPTKDPEPAYKIRYLDANGGFTTRHNAVYIAAFVGCTYHCG